jgi:phosphate transport system substrate-binding protein
MRPLLPLLASALLTLLPGCSRDAAPGAGAGDAGPAPRAVLTVKGSDTMVVLAQRWAEAFMKLHPEQQIQVTGGGSGTGFAALLNGSTDLAMASRPIKRAEAEQVQRRHGAKAEELVVAKDGITFYVHADNPVRALTLEQLRGIYLGDVKNWREVGGPDARIVVYSRENSSGTYAFVKEVLLKEEDFTSEALTLPGTAAVVHAVSLERWGIGYGGAAFGRNVRELPVRVGSEDIAPSKENILSGRYPLSRDLFLYARGAPEGLARRFVDYALSAEGQALVTRAGYFPVR